MVLALGALVHVQVDTLARLAGFFLFALATVAHTDVSLGSPVAGGVPGLVELLGAHGAGPHGGGFVTILTGLSRLSLAGLSRLAAFLSSVVLSLLAPLLVEGSEASFTPLAVFGLEGELVGAEFVCVLLLCAVDTLLALVVLVEDADEGFAVEHGFAGFLLGRHFFLVGHAEVCVHGGLVRAHAGVLVAALLSVLALGLRLVGRVAVPVSAGSAGSLVVGLVVVSRALLSTILSSAVYSAGSVVVGDSVAASGVPVVAGSIIAFQSVVAASAGITVVSGVAVVSAVSSFLAALGTDRSGLAGLIRASAGGQIGSSAFIAGVAGLGS